MQPARKKFRPSLWPTLAVLPVLALCVWAGMWQLERSNEKKRLFQSFDTYATSEPLPALVPENLAGAYQFRRFILRGSYDSEHQILLDSMMHDGRAGYHVLTPLLMGTTAVLINRGWIVADSDRNVLPDIEVGSQSRIIRGRLTTLPRPGIRLAVEETAQDAGWPRRLLFPTALEVENALGIALYDYQLLLDEADANGFVRRWRPQVLGPERHIGYAVQWFSLAALLCGLYFVMSRKRV